MRKVKFSIVFLFLILNFMVYSEEAVIKAIGHHDYAPWNWEQDNEIVGVAAEVCKVLFENEGIKVDLSYLGPWKRGQKLVELGKADVNICSFINEERKKYSEFIMTPMGFNEQAIFVKKGNEFKFENWEDLKGKNIGLVIGVSIGQEFDSYLEENAHVYRMIDYKSLFRMLAAEHIEAVALARNSGKAILKYYGLDSEIIDLENPIITGKLYISMSKRSKYLYILPEIEKQIKKEGYYRWVDKLLEKYIEIYSQKNNENK